MIEKGHILAERYEILGKIGTGGMSDVFKALDTALSREVAIKVLKDDYITDNAFVSKFRAEATAAAGLEHPNIVNIYDVGNEDGRHFIVMEYVEGVTLKTYISKKGYLSTSEVLSVAIQVGRGIGAAHNKNIIHRDIKPQNIIISKDGKVKVTDFGIARAVTSNTKNADRMGSVHYSSPEQTKNGDITYQSDIYSLGIVMYEMCTGRVPYDGDSAVAIALQHLQTEMIPPSRVISGVPISVEKIILKATMKNPDRRYVNMEEMLTDLKQALITPNDDFVVIPPAAVAGDQGSSIPEKIEPKPLPVEEIPLPEDEDEDEDDEDINGVSRKMDKAVTIMAIAAAVVIILIVIYLLGSFFGFFGFGRHKGDVATTSSISAEMVGVPDVLGMTEKKARDEIEKAGFKYQKLGEASSDEYDEGEVMEQTPTGKAPKGSTISVTISSGKGNIDVPSVTGYSQEQAMKTLKDAGFEVNLQQEYSSSVEQGKVIRQDPAGGSKGNEKDTITIWVSRGSELTSIPGVVNYTQSEAENALTRAGFTVTVSKEYSDSVAAGRVISQSKTGQAAPGTSINIVVSEGKKATYKFSMQVTAVGGVDNHIVLCDANGSPISGAAWDIPADRSANVSAGPLNISSGILIYYDTAGTELNRQNVSFTQQ